MNTFQAECFLSLSKTLNFTQTSEEMYISQPTLSRSIAALEQEVGVQLLVRNTKTVELTAAGKCFAANCLALMESYNRGITEARQAREGSIGHLKLGFQQDAFEPFIVDLVNDFQAAHPRIQVELCPRCMSDLMTQLNIGKLDCIVSVGETNLTHPGRLLLSERQECAALPADHPLADRSSINLRELQNERFVAMSPVASIPGFNLLQHYTRETGFTPNVVAFAHNVAALMMMVACHVGVTVLYRDLEIHVRGRVRFIPLEDITPFQRWLIWDRENPNPALKSFLACAEQHSISSESPQNAD